MSLRRPLVSGQCGRFPPAFTLAGAAHGRIGPDGPSWIGHLPCAASDMVDTATFDPGESGCASVNEVFSPNAVWVFRRGAPAHPVRTVTHSRGHVDVLPGHGPVVTSAPSVHVSGVANR
jgi:hypothetical protein